MEPRRAEQESNPRPSPGRAYDATAKAAYAAYVGDVPDRCEDHQAQQRRQREMVARVGLLLLFATLACPHLRQQVGVFDDVGSKKKIGT